MNGKKQIVLKNSSYNFLNNQLQNISQAKYFRFLEPFGISVYLLLSGISELDIYGSGWTILVLKMS